jgi:hypothetical protein
MISAFTKPCSHSGIAMNLDTTFRQSHSKAPKFVRSFYIETAGKDLA